jgi:hypothetical protein
MHSTSSADRSQFMRFACNILCSRRVCVLPSNSDNSIIFNICWECWRCLRWKYPPSYTSVAAWPSSRRAATGVCHNVCRTSCIDVVRIFTPCEAATHRLLTRPLTVLANTLLSCGTIRTTRTVDRYGAPRDRHADETGVGSTYHKNLYEGMQTRGNASVFWRPLAAGTGSMIRNNLRHGRSTRCSQARRYSTVNIEQVATA